MLLCQNFRRDYTVVPSDKVHFFSEEDRKVQKTKSKNQHKLGFIQFISQLLEGCRMSTLSMRNTNGLFNTFTLVLSKSENSKLIREPSASFSIQAEMLKSLFL